MNPLDKRILELRRNHKLREIAEILAAEKFETPRKVMITSNWVQSRLAHLETKFKRSNKVTYTNKKSAPMISIPLEESRAPGKIVAIIASAEDVKEFLRGIL